MVRAPCCEKMGLKKGPWTPEEDQILVNYIQLYGHGNWRALPKQAGLLRCGKSCRLRWTNYLRPDIKRGNFSEEEEETIIKLHEMLGNRWSAIAARLPGRTDNEIKNVWHTHLKKRLNQNYSLINRRNCSDNGHFQGEDKAEPLKFLTVHDMKSSTLECIQVTSPPHCSSDSSSMLTSDNNNNNNNNNIHRNDDLLRNLPDVDESFWFEVLSNDHNNSSIGNYDQGFGGETQLVHEINPNNMHESMDFWSHILTSELKEII